MRTQANGVAVPSKDAPAGDRPRPARQLAPLHEAAHPALPVPDRGACATYRQHGPAADAPPGARAARATRAPPRADDEFLLGPDLLVAPVLDQGATERTALPAAAAAGSTSGARPPIARAAAGSRCGGAAVLRGRREVTVPAPLDGAAAVRPRRRGARRCCRRASTRSPATATASAACDTLARRRATGCGCSPSRAASGARASARARSCARASPPADWTLEVDGHRTPHATGSRPRWRRCAIRSGPARSSVDGRDAAAAPLELRPRDAGARRALRRP